VQVTLRLTRHHRGLLAAAAAAARCMCRWLVFSMITSVWLLLLLLGAGDADAYGTIANCYIGLHPAVQHLCAVYAVLLLLLLLPGAGDADAYGTIADCYTDLDEFEKAAAFYDKYIQVGHVC
jgi:hypothetical protein